MINDTQNLNYKGELEVFNIGDTVIVKAARRTIDVKSANYINVPKGTTGTIKRIAMTGSLGIEVKGFPGNNLHGVLKNTNGVYVKTYQVDKIVSEEADFNYLRRVLNE